MANLGTTQIFGKLFTNEIIETGDVGGNAAAIIGSPFSSHLSNTQTNAENGFRVNIFETVDLESSEIDVDSNDQITVTQPGTYNISWMVNFRRTGSGARNIMYSEVELNGSNLSTRTRVTDYIRNDRNGDECSTGSSVYLYLSEGDSINIYANEERGGESGNDIERAFINIQKVR